MSNVQSSQDYIDVVVNKYENRKDGVISAQADKIKEYFENLQELNKEALALADKANKLKREIFYLKPQNIPSQAGYPPDKEISQDGVRLLHAGIGMVTESIEFFEEVIKGLKTGEFDKIHLIEESGDLQWYTAVAIDTLNTSFETVWRVNDDKLDARHKGAYNTKNVLHRDTENEKRIMEEGLKNG